MIRKTTAEVAFETLNSNNESRALGETLVQEILDYSHIFLPSISQVVSRKDIQKLCSHEESIKIAKSLTTVKNLESLKTLLDKSKPSYKSEKQIPSDTNSTSTGKSVSPYDKIIYLCDQLDEGKQFHLLMVAKNAESKHRASKDVISDLEVCDFHFEDEGRCLIEVLKSRKQTTQLVKHICSLLKHSDKKEPTTDQRFISKSSTAFKIHIHCPDDTVLHRSVGFVRIGEEEGKRKAIKLRNKLGQELWGKYWTQVLHDEKLLIRLPHSLEPQIVYKPHPTKNKPNQRLKCYIAKWRTDTENEPKRYKTVVRSIDKYGKLAAYSQTKRAIMEAQQHNIPILQFMGRYRITKLL